MNKLIIFTALVFLFSGCLVGPKYSGTETEKPEQYIQAAQKTDSVTNLKWWEVYQDTVLQAIIDTALKNNRDLMIAVARVEQAKATLGYNKAQQWPGFGYGATSRFTDVGENSQLAGFPGESYSLLGNVSWEIDLWGKIRHAKRAAYADLLATEENQRSVYISMVAQIAEMYFNLRGLDQRKEITEKAFNSRKEYFRIINARFEKGDVAELDKLQAEQLMASSEADLYTIERQIIVIENALNIMLGRTYAPVSRGLTNSQQQLPVEIPAGLPSQLLERRPDVMAAEQKLISQTELIGVAVAKRFPSLSLTGFFGLASPEIGDLFNPGAFIGSVTGQLTGPIFQFGMNKRRVEVERAKAKELGYQYELVVLNSFAEVDNSLAEIRTYSKEYNARKVQVTANSKALTLSKALYDNGYTSFLQVLDAERELYNSEYQESVALENQLISVAKLYKALGGGWETQVADTAATTN